MSLDLDGMKKKKKEAFIPLAAQVTLDDSNQVKAIEEVKEEIKRLYESINGQEPVDFTKFEYQLALLNDHLDLKEHLEELTKAVKDNKQETISIKDFSKLLQAVEKNKVEVDLEPLRKAIIQVEQRIQENAVDPQQAPDEYQPVRRVIKVGNKLVFDDQPTPTRGGGGGSSSSGGSSSGGLTDAELRASAVGVSVTSALPAGTNNIGDVDVLSVIPGTGATNLGKAVDDVAGATDTGVVVLGVRDDVLTTLTPADGDYARPRVGQYGDWWVSLATKLDSTNDSVSAVQATAANLNMTEANSAAIAASASVLDDWDESDRAKTNPIVGQAGVQGASGTVSANTQRVVLATDVALPAGTNTIGKLAANSGVDIGDVDVTSAVITGGGIADDATTPGNPIMVGGYAVETDGTDPGSVSAEDDVVRARFDRNRRILVNKAHPNAWKVFEDHTSAQTNNQLKGAPGANLSLYITDIIFSNGATVGSIKLVEDEGGTPAQLTQTVYMPTNGGAVMSFETPIRMTANKSLGFTSTTVTTHSVEVHGYTAP